MGIVPINAVFTESDVFIFHNHPKDTFTFALKAFVKPFEAPQKRAFQSQALC